MNIPWQSQDAFVVMGEPRWVAEFVRLYVQSVGSLDGGVDVWIYSDTPPDTVEKGGWIENGRVMYPARFMNLMTTFTERNVVETIGDSGKVVKTSIFKHGGFIRLL